MKRRAFLQFIGLGAMVVPVAGKIISGVDSIPDGEDSKSDINWKDPINHPLSSRRSVYPRLYDKVEYRGSVYYVTGIVGHEYIADYLYLTPLDPGDSIRLSMKKFNGECLYLASGLGDRL